MTTPNKLTLDQKRKWFSERVDSEFGPVTEDKYEKFLAFARDLRKRFNDEFSRDVSGSFFRTFLNLYGFERHYSDTIKVKRDWMFDLLDKNQAFRDSKSQCRRAVVNRFGESILNVVFDELWLEYHKSPRCDPTENIDLFGQTALFE